MFRTLQLTNYLKNLNIFLSFINLTFLECKSSLTLYKYLQNYNSQVLGDILMSLLMLLDVVANVLNNCFFFSTATNVCNNFKLP